MRASSGGRAGDDLAQLFEPKPGGRDDRALLDRYRLDGDGRAFEGLVARHGPMVLGVCRRALGDAHDADDAFQATFLVLARRARSVRDADRLGPWLHGVARRVSAKARVGKARRRERPAVAPETWPDRAAPAADRIDVPAVLDEELARLSGKLRSVLVLCLLEGLTAEEAADRLGCPVGTAKSRLARGRLALRRRLEGRGLAPDAGLSLLAPAATRVPLTLFHATLGVVGRSAAVAPAVAALARGVAPAMIAKLTLMTSLSLGGIALAYIGLATGAQGPAQAPPAPVASKSGEETKQHIKTIALGFHVFHSNEGHLPPSATRGSDGQPQLSWRVAILPDLGEEDLFKQFHLEEPWNSVHNQALIGRMPAVFQTPDSPAPEGQTRLRVFTGSGTMFDGAEGIRFDQITDGTSHTALVAVAREPIDWTRPDELSFAPDQPLPPLDDRDPSRYILGMVDGSIRDVDPANVMLLRAMITRNGGEVITWPMRPGMPPPPPPQVAAQIADGRRVVGVPRIPGGVTSPPSSVPPGGTVAQSQPSAAVEDRLRRLEEKVDLLIRKLDAGPTPARP